jgi:hypothetical protein
MSNPITNYPWDLGKNLKPEVATVGDLPEDGNINGDIRFVTDSNALYGYTTASGWVSLTSSGGGGNAFGIIITDTGTHPTANQPDDSFAITDPSGKIQVAGNSSTKKVTLSLNVTQDDIPDGSTYVRSTPSEQASWTAKQAALGFTPENIANKDTDGTLASNSDTKYPSQKATKTYVDTGLATKQATLGYTAENVANKGVASGYAPLGSDAKVPSLYLPSYVDEVQAYANLAAFPATGLASVIYIANDTNKTYRWSGSAYVEISPSPGTTDSLVEGSVNLYFTAARVLATVLTGLSTSTNSEILATDTEIVALGKLQAQLNAAGSIYDAAGSAAAAQAFAIQRSNHTGTQTASTISDFNTTSLAQLLTGYTTGTPGTITSSTSLLTAIETLVANGSAFATSVASTYAPLNSPTFTGTPSIPTGTTGVTQSPLNNSTNISTTAYADTAVGIEKTRALAAEALLAPLASPVLTGNPTAPTQTSGDNSTKLATTAFVLANATSKPSDISGVYKDGSDGNITLTTNTTLTRNMYYNNLTINSGVTLTTAGYIVYVLGTLTGVDATSIINDPANNASGSVAGAVRGSSRPLGSGSAGTAGGVTGSGAGGNATISNAGQFFGGETGLGGAGVGAAGSNAGSTGISSTYGGPGQIWDSLTWQSFTLRASTTSPSGPTFQLLLSGRGGTGGGGGTGAGGGGGAGGNIIAIFCRFIAGTLTITANGGNGANGAGAGCGGGGGGGGGVVLITTETTDPTTVATINIASGNPGSAGGAGGSNGNNGGTGTYKWKKMLG